MFAGMTFCVFCFSYMSRFVAIVHCGESVTTAAFVARDQPKKADRVYSTLSVRRCLSFADHVRGDVRLSTSRDRPSTRMEIIAGATVLEKCVPGGLDLNEIRRARGTLQPISLHRVCGLAARG